MELDHKVGLHYCGGDESLYIENLKDFYNTSETKQDQLKNCATTGHLNDYLIEVHALKSIARNIGAETLSETAFEHETQSRLQDVEFIRDNVDGLLEQWNAVLQEIRDYVGEKTLTQKIMFESNGIILSRDVLDKRISQIIDALCAYENDEAERRLGDLLRYKLPEHIYSRLLEAYQLTGNFEYVRAIEVLERDD